MLQREEGERGEEGGSGFISSPRSILIDVNFISSPESVFINV
jgi:hypothetical protein